MKKRITLKEGKTFKGYWLGVNGQYLLKPFDAFAYSAGVYGWNCDYYLIGDNVLIYGYRGNGNVIPYNIIKKYDNKAKKVLDNEHNYNIKRTKIYDIINDMIDELENRGLNQ